MGGLFGGGGGSSSSVSSSVTLDIKPTSAMTLNENIDIKPVELKPVTLNENIDLQPVTLNENIDLKPVALDSCQTLKLAPLPETTVCNPYHHRIAMTVFGIEIMNLVFGGQTEQNIQSPRRPRVTERTHNSEAHHPHHRKAHGHTGGISVRVIDPDE
ncbi:MAG TPA: hypothetical protein VH496_19720 [Mycobacterium sp.]